MSAKRKFYWPLVLAAALSIGGGPSMLRAQDAECPAPGRTRCLAEAGNLAAQFNVGMQIFGQGTSPEIHAEALRWFRRAAEGGFGRAQYMLAMMLWEGWGTERDPERASAWIDAAASNGVMDGARLKPRIEAWLAQQSEQQ